MSPNWEQIGTDFQQKYEGTFCRFISPVTGIKEVFLLQYVTPHSIDPPDLILFNENHGDLFLRWNTEGELDFTFPEIGYFQHENKALRFVRNYERQWKKGICQATAQIKFPYDNLKEGLFPGLNCNYLESAFQTVKHSLEGAIKELNDKKLVSIVLSKTLALGIGNTSKDYILWFESDPIAQITTTGDINIKVPDFFQEIKDFLRDTGEYGRVIV